MCIKKTSVDFDITNTIQQIYRKSHNKNPYANNTSNFRISNQFYRTTTTAHSDLPVKVQLKKFINTPNSSTSTVFTEKAPKPPIKPIISSSNSTTPKTLDKSMLIKHKLSSSQTGFSVTGQLNSSTPITKQRPYHRKSFSQSECGNKPVPGRLSSSSSTKSMILTKNSYDNKTKQSNKTYFDKLINVEDLILLEERLNDVIRSIYNSEKMYYSQNEGGICHACFEWWLFYFGSSLLEKYKSFFWETNNRLIIHSANNLELFTILLTYDIANNPSFLKSFRVILKSVFSLLKHNYLLIVKKILSTLSYSDENQINTVNSNKIYITKLNEVLQNNQIIGNFTEDSIAMKIKQNCGNIVEYIKIILMQYQNTNHVLASGLTEIFNSISKIDNGYLNNFFYEKVLLLLNKNRSIVNSAALMKKVKQKTVNPPYITTPLKKKYSLVLDLDETLICFKFKSQNDNSGTLYLRPGLFRFLREMKENFEIISFTAATREYAEPILNSIEGKEKFFDYKLYREHAVVIGKDFVKDISRIGRDLKKIIIVDNMGMNFRLCKENGILIYPYYFQDKRDTALTELKNILNLIVEEDFGDIRDGLFKYRNELIMKVSSNVNCL